MFLQQDAKRIGGEHLHTSRLCSPQWGHHSVGFLRSLNGVFISWHSARVAEAWLLDTSSGRSLLPRVVEGDIAWGKMKITSKKMAHKLILHVLRFEGIECESQVKRTKQEVGAEYKVLKQDLKGATLVKIGNKAKVPGLKMIRCSDKGDDWLI